MNRHNYDLLRMETQTPRLLVVLDLPREEKRWVTITANKLILRRRAYWLSLQGREATDNRSSVTVHIPRGNVFDVENLRALMDQSRRGGRRMRVDIRDAGALQAISPAALSAYARSAGWRKVDTYGAHSDVYAAEELPEVILPRTDRLGDYAGVVSRLLAIFAEAAGRDELSLYRDLVTADRDVVRARVTEAEDGSLTLNHSVELIAGVRDLVLAAACSLREPQPLYRLGANREANDLLDRIRLGQTEHGSFVVTLLTPPVSPQLPTPIPEDDDYDDPIERRMTRRLFEALTATREATERAMTGDGSAFVESVCRGVSANLCESLVQLVDPFPALDISVAWAQTRPISLPRKVFRFATADAAILREAARGFRDREPRPDTHLFGSVQRLRREEEEAGGTIYLRTSIDGTNRSVAVVLKSSDYERAVQAHKEKLPMILRGDLERSGQRWRLLNPRIDAIIDSEGPSHEIG